MRHNADSKPQEFLATSLKMQHADILQAFNKIETKLCYKIVIAVPLMRNFKPTKVKITNVSMKLFPQNK